MTTRSNARTVTPPVDADELVTILLTLAGCAVLFAVAMLIEANRIAATFGVWPPALFVVAALCAVGAVVIRAIGSKV